MKCNVGKTDRAVRAIIGLVIIAAGIYFRSWWGLIGLLFLVSAALGWCLGYLSFGISTCKTNDTPPTAEEERV